MLALAAAAIFLPASHMLLAAGPVRAALVARLGELGHRGLYSVIALLALAWLIQAYIAAPAVAIPAVPGAAWVAPVLTLPAFILVAGGYLAPNPTGLGQQDRLYPKLDQPRGLLRITRHPIQWGVALWAGSHLAAAGELGGALLFTSLLVLALGGAAHQDRRLARAYPSAWPAFAQATSFVPGTALRAGRQQLRPAEIGWLAPIAGLVGWGLLIAAHGLLFGVPAGPG